MITENVKSTRAERIVRSTIASKKWLPVIIFDSRQQNRIRRIALNLFQRDSTHEHQRKTGWLNIIQTEDAARNPVELFDFIDGTEYLATGHRFDVINGAL